MARLISWDLNNNKSFSTWGNQFWWKTTTAPPAPPPAAAAAAAVPAQQEQQEQQEQEQQQQQQQQQQITESLSISNTRNLRALQGITLSPGREKQMLHNGGVSSLDICTSWQEMQGSHDVFVLGNGGEALFCSLFCGLRHFIHGLGVWMENRPKL